MLAQSSPARSNNGSRPLKSLSADFNPNALKYTYDYSCFLARSTKYQHLMTSTSTPTVGQAEAIAEIGDVVVGGGGLRGGLGGRRGRGLRLLRRVRHLRVVAVECTVELVPRRG